MDMYSVKLVTIDKHRNSSRKCGKMNIQSTVFEIEACNIGACLMAENDYFKAFLKKLVNA